MKLRSKFLAAIAAVALALGLVPGLAFAAESTLQAGSISDLSTQATATIDSVRTAIQGLSADPLDFTADDKAAVEAIQKDFDSLSAEDQKTLDNESSHKATSQSLGRVLESAVWSVRSFDAIDTATTLPDGTYDATTTPKLTSTSDKGKSTSPRVRTWTVESITVKGGHATATLSVNSDTIPAIWRGGKEIKKSSASSAGKAVFENVEIDLNSTFYIGGISETMPAPTMYAVTATIDESAPAPTPADKVKRLEGDVVGDAYDTMTEVVSEGWKSSDTVVIARFDGYWDALAASGLAGSEGAPVLLTDKGSLSPKTRKVIESLGAKRAYICGGTDAVSKGVEDEIAGMGLAVERFKGDMAFNTAEEISARARLNLGADCDTCVIATIDGFYDSLSVAPAAYSLGMPVYLTDWDFKLADSTVKAIKDAGYTKAVIVGGKDAVKEGKDGVEGQLSLGTSVKSFTRLAGDNAWQTSEKIAKWGLDNGLGASTVGVADGNGYWDALTGAPLIGLRGGSLVLVPHDGMSSDGKWHFGYDPYCIENFIAKNAASVEQAYVFGGPAAVTEQGYNDVVEALTIKPSAPVELKITNNVKMFKPGKTATLVTVGKARNLTLSMESDSYTKASVGTPAEAGAADAVVAELGEGNTFALDVQGTTDGEPFVMSFWSERNQLWYGRQATLDEKAGTLVFDPWVDPAPANTVDEKIHKIQSQAFTDTTWADCEDAKAAWDALKDEEKALVEEYDYFGLDTGDASKDDPLNADKIGENEILVVSFGTSFNDSRVATIGGVEKALAKAYPDWSVRRAFTAQIIINHVYARDGEKIDNMDQALARAEANGVKTLVVQPTHLMHGAEYDELVEALKPYESKMTIKVAEPLLGEVGADGSAVNADKEAVAKAVVAEANVPSDTALVLMGHGTAHEANVTYTQMQTVMDQLGYKNVFVGTVEGEPEGTDAEAVIAKVKAAGYKKVVLRPLMVVAGDHANNDMADPDDPESWLSQFKASGAFDPVECQINGLGEIAAVQDLYVAHTGAAINPGLSKIAYDGTEYKMVKDDLTSTFGMLSPAKDTTVTMTRSNGKINVKYTPSNTSVYNGVYLDADISDSSTWVADRFLAITSGADFEFSIDESYAGYAWPVAPTKAKDPTATTSAQYYMAIPALDKIPTA